MTESTFFKRDLALAFRVLESFHGVFLDKRQESLCKAGARFKRTRGDRRSSMK